MATFAEFGTTTETLEDRTLLSGVTLPLSDGTAEAIKVCLPFEPQAKWSNTSSQNSPTIPKAITGTDDISDVNDGTFDLTKTFLLQSNPGSNFTIYLDFDGHTTSGTLWNNSIYHNGTDIVTPAWSLDADQNSLSDLERETIQRIWAGVAEDFAPFDVNVVTGDPGVEALRKVDNNDTEWGIRVLFGEEAFSAPSGAGGIAYVTSFNWDTDTPAYVFNGGYVGGRETASHEVGHALGLDHDGTLPATPANEYYGGHGTGATSWGPIMGGSFAPAVTQWSKGEYTDASNQEDDLDIITTQNGFGYRTDDYGNDIAGATAFTNSIQGIIETNTDIDFFTFTIGAGVIDLKIETALHSANLDVFATLYDDAGNVIVQSNPVDGLGASFTGTFAAGTYFLSVEGTGKGAVGGDGYSDYGSLGNYWISGINGTQAFIAAIDNISLPRETGTPINFAGSVTGGIGPFTYAWDFGDGTAGAGANSTHTYNADGNYTVKFTATDFTGATATVQQVITVTGTQVNLAAVINSISTPRIKDQRINFTGSATGGTGPFTYAWDFGDGTANAPGQNTSHVYVNDGRYIVKFTVTDATGATETVQQTIVVTRGVLLVPSIDSISTPRVTDTQIHFKGSATGETGTLTYQWSFGDGSTATGQNVSHAYSNAGDYKVTFTVTDTAHGSSHSVAVTKLITVDVPPEVGDNRYRVNTYRNDEQSHPSTAMSADGRSVVVWQSAGQDGYSMGIYGQRYHADGTEDGGEFRISLATNKDQDTPAVAMAADGRFVVVWESFGQDRSGNGIYAQRYNADGTKIGNEFRANLLHTTADQSDPAIAIARDGAFVIVWKSSGQDGSGNGVYGQRYNSFGVKTGSQFRVNTTTNDDQDSPTIAMAFNGNFVVAWESLGQDSADNDGIYAQRYNADGTKIGGEFRVNSHTTGEQGDPAIAITADGRFVIVWQSAGQDGSAQGVYAQRYNANGTKAGAEFRVNTTTGNDQDSPAVAMDSTGRFVIAWESFTQDGSGDGVYVQRYNADGTPIDNEFRTNRHTARNQGDPSVAIGYGGHFIVAWQSDGQDGSKDGIYARNLTMEPLKPKIESISAPHIKGAPLHFNGSAADKNGTLTYEWDFGDGSTAAGQNVSHTYANNGRYTVMLTVRDEDGRTSNITQVITIVDVAPTAPTLTGPVGSIVGGVASITWSPGVNATSYELLIYNVEAGQQVFRQAGFTGTSHSVSLGHGEHQVFVRSANGAGHSVWSKALYFVMAAAAAPAAPVLTGPIGTAGSGAVDVTWNAVAGAASYELLIYNVKAGQQVFRQAGLAGTSHKLPLGNGEHQMFLRVAKSSGGHTAWSKSMHFVVTSAAAPVAPVLTGPTGTTGSGAVDVTWNAVAGATSYELLIYNVKAGQQVFRQAGLAGTSHKVSLGSGEHQMFLRVAKSSGGHTAWSKSLHFVVAGTAAALAQPTFIAPVGTVSAGAVKIEWNAATAAVEYEVLIYDMNIGQQVANPTGITGTSHTRAFAAGRYQLFVRAVDSSGKHTSWSSPLEFDVVSVDAAPQNIGTQNDNNDDLLEQAADRFAGTQFVSVISTASFIGNETAADKVVAAQSTAAKHHDQIFTAWSDLEWWNDEQVGGEQIAVVSQEAVLLEAELLETDQPADTPSTAGLLLGGLLGFALPKRKSRKTRHPKTDRQQR